ncbi:MAG: hypothetical protein K0R70_1427, partial [Steroidobacteraceae bacterium]|nr:hypothetical protein [Steroidobacteraceae bacterium]
AAWLGVVFYRMRITRNEDSIQRIGVVSKFLTSTSKRVSRRAAVT